MYTHDLDQASTLEELVGNIKKAFPSVDFEVSEEDQVGDDDETEEIEERLARKLKPLIREMLTKGK